MEPSSHPICFEHALGELQAMLGTRLRAAILADGLFFGATFSAELQRIETLPGDRVVTLCFSGGETVDLDPRETEAFSFEASDRPDGLEFRMGAGLALEITPDPDSE